MVVKGSRNSGCRSVCYRGGRSLPGGDKRLQRSARPSQLDERVPRRRHGESNIPVSRCSAWYLREFENDTADILIFAGGIAGPTTAYELTIRHSGRQVAVIEKAAAADSGITQSHLTVRTTAVRAQAVTADGSLLDDFLFGRRHARTQRGQCGSAGCHRIVEHRRAHSR